MMLDRLIQGLIYIFVFFVLFYVGKLIYTRLHKDFNLNVELVEKDNPAVCLALTGYYAALVLSLGGSVVGPSHGIMADLMDLVIYGCLSIVLLNISVFLCDWVILRQFNIKDELIRDRNQGTGAVVFGTCMASGFVIFGSVSGTGGSVFTAAGYWALGQLLLLAAAKFYNFITPFDIHEEIEKDNVAAGISVGGALLAVGIVVGLAAEGDFVSWRQNIPEFIAYSIIGLVSLPLIRLVTDKLLVPGVSLSDEILGLKPDKSIEQRGPNTGASYIEAFAYIAGAFIIYWCI